MKGRIFLLSAITLFTSLANAKSLSNGFGGEDFLVPHQDMKVASVLHALRANVIDEDALVLDRQKLQTPEGTVVEILAGIPVEVDTQSACVDFVGQQAKLVNGIEVLYAVGASDPVNKVCIEIMPLPVKTYFTTKFSYLKSFDNMTPAELRKKVKISGQYMEVVYSLATNRVYIEKAFLADLH